MGGVVPLDRPKKVAIFEEKEVAAFFSRPAIPVPPMRPRVNGAPSAAAEALGGMPLPFLTERVEACFRLGEGRVEGDGDQAQLSSPTSNPLGSSPTPKPLRWRTVEAAETRRGQEGDRTRGGREGGETRRVGHRPES